jgi:hypothetical protein
LPKRTSIYRELHQNQNILGFGYALCLGFAFWLTSSVVAQEILPKPQPPFKGIIGETYKDSKSDFPQPIKPPPGAPNVLIVLIDDLGFGWTASYGGRSYS